MQKKIVFGLIVFILFSTTIALTIIAFNTSKPVMKNAEIHYDKLIIQKQDIEPNILQQFEKYKQELKDNYKENIESLNNKFNIFMVILGIVFSVWIGLNIYNIYNAEELKSLKNEFKETKKESEQLLKKLNELDSIVNNLSTGVYNKQAVKNSNTRSTNNTINNHEYLYTRVHFVLYMPSRNELDNIISNENVMEKFMNNYFFTPAINGEIDIIDHSVRFDTYVNAFFVIRKYLEEDKIRIIFEDVLKKYNNDIWIGYIRN